MGLVKNRVVAVLVLSGLVAALGLPFLTHAPNRLVSGVGISLVQLISDTAARPIGSWLAWSTLLPALLLVAAVFMHPAPRTQTAVYVAATLLLTGLAALAAQHATQLADQSGAIARTSLGAAFWLLAAFSWLAATDAMQRLALRPGWRLMGAGAVIVPLGLMLAGGAFKDLSLLKEYANRQDVFSAALGQHVQIVLASLLPALLMGVPLGLASNRSLSLRAPLFAVLNVIQTVPSIALFALLMAPLALLAASVPVLAQLGIKGIGLAPAVIALTLYALLPVVRSTAAGLSQVPQPVIEAAQGMGLTARQVFWRVELPLALPVFLAGLRVATVQTIGMAVVAALIGAGGFGAIVFQGLLSGALDLVLLGVLPVVAMAVVVDALLKALALALESNVND
ncbi:MAG: ABC transporter permease [Rhodoferax sp.]|uniref:ABC transporter permease n=1 Tax=Rhodoferax sp. TaxID=50421 RepID=UPI001400BE3E|nr:ABC transporter permease [Rhodoferax sp.]NDP38496.1 ABC transporter permease [Rhodoferax sp.]